MDSGNIAWGATAMAMVLLMTPGLAFFYGGLVKAKSVVSMMMMSFGALALVSVLWILYGYGMTVESSPNQFSGNPFSHFGLEGLSDTEYLSSGFAATFAIITTALISGAIADRAKFGSWLIFAGLWVTLVYFPVASWVWGGGWIQNLGTALGLPNVIDYAGGTVVEINSGAAALALSLVLGKRFGFAKGIMQPHNVPLVLLGAGILWFGWFGFNAGAEFLGDMSKVGLILINTLSASAMAVVGWLIVERLREGKATSVGAASGAIAGLVAITPSCANLTPGYSLLLGLITGVVCCLAIELKYRLGYDDSLDVVGIHLVGGLVGMLYLGFFALETGFIYSGDFGQLIVQAIASVAVFAFSFAGALGIAWLVEKLFGFRVHSEDEVAGIDLVVHGEAGYNIEDQGR